MEHIPKKQPGRLPEFKTSDELNKASTTGDLETLKQAFSSLESGDQEQCDRAARLYAKAAKDGLIAEKELPIMLSRIPHGMERGPLYAPLARAMCDAGVDAKSW